MSARPIRLQIFCTLAIIKDIDEIKTQVHNKVTRVPSTLRKSMSDTNV